jgi:hypothetical protein
LLFRTRVRVLLHAKGSGRELYFKSTGINYLNKQEIFNERSRIDDAKMQPKKKTVKLRNACTMYLKIEEFMAHEVKND